MGRCTGERWAQGMGQRTCMTWACDGAVGTTVGCHGPGRRGTWPLGHATAARTCGGRAGARRLRGSCAAAAVPVPCDASGPGAKHSLQRPRGRDPTLSAALRASTGLPSLRCAAARFRLQLFLMSRAAFFSSVLNCSSYLRGARVQGRKVGDVWRGAWSTGCEAARGQPLPGAQPVALAALAPRSCTS